MLVSMELLCGELALLGAVPKDLPKRSTKSMVCISSSPSLSYSFPPPPIGHTPKLHCKYIK